MGRNRKAVQSETSRVDAELEAELRYLESELDSSSSSDSVSSSHSYSYEYENQESNTNTNPSQNTTVSSSYYGSRYADPPASSSYTSDLVDHRPPPPRIAWPEVPQTDPRRSSDLRSSGHRSSLR